MLAERFILHSLQILLMSDHETIHSGYHSFVERDRLRYATDDDDTTLPQNTTRIPIHSSTLSNLEVLLCTRILEGSFTGDKWNAPQSDSTNNHHHDQHWFRNFLTVRYCTRFDSSHLQQMVAAAAARRTCHVSLRMPLCNII
jgi:hypothetical protein